MSVQSSLCTLPAYVLEDIAVYTLDPLGPPKELLSLLLTCRSLYNALSLPHLYAQIFRFKFDWTSAKRRIGNRANYPSNLAQQLKVYCRTLQAVRSGDIHAATLLDTLWNAFFMMIENDGRNAAQLLNYAGLKAFAKRLVFERLWEDMRYGWPVQKAANSLALWLYWFSTDAGEYCSYDRSY